MRAISDDNLIFSVLLLIVQILSFACGVGAPIPAIPVAGLLSPPAVAVTVVLPVVDEIVAGGRGWLLAGVDVDELCCRLAAAAQVVTVGRPATDWARLAMIMSLRVRVPPPSSSSVAAGDSEGAMAAGSEVALWMSGSFLALNKRILRGVEKSRQSRHH